MDLTQLANLGEFVGGAAVLVTLVYLAVQIRQTKDLAVLESARSTSKDYTAFLFQLMNPDHMELFRRGLNDFNGLSENDQARLHVWLPAVFMSAQTTHAL